MFNLRSREVPSRSVDDLLTVPDRPLAPLVAVITVTRGVDPRARRDPAALDDTSPYFATTSESPRTR